MHENCYIILAQSIKDLTQFSSEIKKYGTWARITDDTWAMVSTKSASEVRDHLKTFIKDDGRLFVVKSGIEAAWKNVICSNEWLKKNL